MTIPPQALATAAAPKTLTPAEAIASAIELRDQLIAEAPDTEARSFHSEAIHLEFAKRGFYNLFRPKMFGGYEFSVPDFMKVIEEVAHGDMAAAWSLCLSSGHNLQIASWWPEEQQREFFAGPHFSCAMTVAPGGTIVRDGDDYIVNSVHQYASGQAYATHFAGHAVDPKTGQWSTFITPRGTWTVDDDWGDSTGLRGSGSHSVRLDNVRIPAGNVLVGRMQQDMIFEGGSPGFHLHGNPIYNGRTLGFFGLELVAITVGAVRGALDEYEKLMHTKRIFIPPFTIRSEDPYYQTWYGDAESRLIAAEAIVDRAGSMITAAAEREASGGAPFSLEEDFLINSVAHQAMVLAWNVMQDTLFKTAGTSASRAGSRLERIWRDVSQAWGHVNIVLHDWTAASYAQHHLGTVPQPQP